MPANRPVSLDSSLPCYSRDGDEKKRARSGVDLAGPNPLTPSPALGEEGGLASGGLSVYRVVRFLASPRF